MQGRVEFEVRVGPRRGRAVLGADHSSGLGYDARTSPVDSSTTPLTCESRRCFDLRGRRSPAVRRVDWRPAMDTGQLHAIDAPLEKGRRFTHLTGAPSIDISFPDTFLAPRRVAPPTGRKVAAVALDRVLGSVPIPVDVADRSQVVSSHNAHVIVEPSTSNWRFSVPSLAVNRLPTP